MKRCALLGLFLLVVTGCHNDDQQSVETLTESLEDDDPNVRYSAAKALGKYGPEATAAVPALADALQDQDSDVRMGAAYALAKIGPDAEDAVPALQAALKDKNKDVREAADYALKQIQAHK